MCLLELKTLMEGISLNQTYIHCISIIVMFSQYRSCNVIIIITQIFVVRVFQVIRFTYMHVLYRLLNLI